MSEPFIAQIVPYSFNFAPKGWAMCNGQILPIAQNQALFSLLGTTYGGNGVTTFALPNLQSRTPIHMGQGPGLSNYVLGQVGGLENVTLLTPQLPMHNHLWNCVATAGDQGSPTGHLNASEGTGQITSYSDVNPDNLMSPTSIAPTGGNQPHPNIQPYLTINYCIALVGIFPSRN